MFHQYFCLPSSDVEADQQEEEETEGGCRGPVMKDALRV